MSLEIAIAENTAAIHALIAALPALANGTAPAAEAEKPKVVKKEAAAKNDAAPASEPTPSASDSSASSSSESGETKALTYDDIKVPFLDLIKTKGRDAAMALLGEYGAAKLPDIGPESYADVLAAIEKAAA